MSVNEVFGPSYFDILIVTDENYKHLLTSYFPLMLLTLPSDTMFSLEKAIPHYSLNVSQLLNEKIPDL